nr:MAG TPA: hypothetical protein [Caudoviricetes sp.]DAN83595.1 MAG TPA: hypothetical protein [Caudoviricetes sp.]DAW63054.1 MAG TPA: hypothetical protein [Caudoviricetes sp.]
MRALDTSSCVIPAFTLAAAKLICKIFITSFPKSYQLYHKSNLI